MAALTADEAGEIVDLLGAVRKMDKVRPDPILLYDSNGEYVGQIKYDTHNGYMYYLPGDLGVDE
jgi:hypothetical protein